MGCRLSLSGSTRSVAAIVLLNELPLPEGGRERDRERERGRERETERERDTERDTHTGPYECYHHAPELYTSNNFHGEKLNIFDGIR